MAASSADVSDVLVRAATTGTGCRPAVPNGWARTAARSLGRVAGRTWLLLGCDTLASDGSCVAAAIAPTIHTRTTSQRNRTAKRPMALKVASIRIVRKPTGDPRAGGVGNPGAPP